MAGAYPDFISMKHLGLMQLPLEGMLVHRRVTSQRREIQAQEGLFAALDFPIAGFQCHAIQNRSK